MICESGTFCFAAYRGFDVEAVCRSPFKQFVDGKGVDALGSQWQDRERQE